MSRHILQHRQQMPYELLTRPPTQQTSLLSNRGQRDGLHRKVIRSFGVCVQRLYRSKGVCVMGDSIAREAGDRIGHLIGRLNVRFLTWHDHEIGQLDQSLSYLTRACCKLSRGNATSTDHAAVEADASCSSDVPTSCGDCGVLVIGGTSLHFLLRSVAPRNLFHDVAIKLTDPVSFHAAYIREVAAAKPPRASCQPSGDSYRFSVGG